MSLGNEIPLIDPALILGQFKRSYQLIQPDNLNSEWESWEKLPKKSFILKLPELKSGHYGPYSKAFFRELDKLIKSNKSNIRYFSNLFKENLYTIFEDPPDFEEKDQLVNVCLTLIQTFCILADTPSSSLNDLQKFYENAQIFIYHFSLKCDFYIAQLIQEEKLAAESYAKQFSSSQKNIPAQKDKNPDFSSSSSKLGQRSYSLANSIPHQPAGADSPGKRTNSSLSNNKTNKPPSTLKNKVNSPASSHKSDPNPSSTANTKLNLTSTANTKSSSLTSSTTTNSKSNPISTPTTNSKSNPTSSTTTNSKSNPTSSTTTNTKSNPTSTTTSSKPSSETTPSTNTRLNPTTSTTTNTKLGSTPSTTTNTKTNSTTSTTAATNTKPSSSTTPSTTTTTKPNSPPLSTTNTKPSSTTTTTTTNTKPYSKSATTKLSSTPSSANIKLNSTSSTTANQKESLQSSRTTKTPSSLNTSSPRAGKNDTTPKSTRPPSRSTHSRPKLTDSDVNSLLAQKELIVTLLQSHPKSKTNCDNVVNEFKKFKENIQKYINSPQLDSYYKNFINVSAITPYGKERANTLITCLNLISHHIHT